MKPASLLLIRGASAGLTVRTEGLQDRDSEADYDGQRMKSLAEKGLEEEKRLFLDGQSIEDLEVGVAFWLAVDECELCDTSLCSIHYERFYNTM